MPLLFLTSPSPPPCPRRASRCRASSSSSEYRRTTALPAWAVETDLYGLLGVPPSSGPAEIKAAYRALQKRCHPDVAGAATGHDMAIVLNEAYALLSDPLTRLAYDREQAKASEFAGYTGQPLYSAWLGPASEERAVFVDEVRCVGCLKCALLASRTFAVESAFGRARVVAQWADGEDEIADAIRSCPVDCIQMVERSRLPALEFLMSKQPRGSVRMAAGNAVGAPVPDVFSDAAKFESRFQEARRRGSAESEKISAARESAMHAIRSISGWLYWRPFVYPAPDHGLKPTDNSVQPQFTRRLKEAAARRNAQPTAHYGRGSDNYWTPLPAPPPSPQASPETPRTQRRERPAVAGGREKVSRIDLRVPAAMGLIAAAIARSAENAVGGGGIRDHVAGAAAVQIVNSSELRVVLAGITWFVIGAALAGLAETFRRR